MAQHEKGTVSEETFDDFLAEQGLLQACENHAIKEIDQGATTGLKKTAQELGVADKLTFANKVSQKADLWVINPPRNGMGELRDQIDALPVTRRPKGILYMSCFWDSFKTDANILHALGFKLQKAALLEQFPQTPHFELMTLWS